MWTYTHTCRSSYTLLIWLYGKLCQCLSPSDSENGQLIGKKKNYEVEKGLKTAVINYSGYDI